MTQQRFNEADRAYAAELFDAVRALSQDKNGVTREGHSAKEDEVLAYLGEKAEALGMSREVDRAGNVWYTLKGKDSSLPVVVAGSHVDSVPVGGNFDGLAGVVAAMTAVYHWKRVGTVLPMDFKVLMLRLEESSFYGKAYVGSLGMMGRLTEKDLALTHRAGTNTLGQALERTGVNLADVTGGAPLIDISRIRAFIELHIEQGPMLDGDPDTRVGLVTGIRGNIRHKQVVCKGVTAHSGAVDKAFRHDALMATAELIHAAENHWQRVLDAGEDLVFTVGVMKLGGNAAISVIPGEVVFSTDTRSLKLETCEAFEAWLMARAKEIGEARGVSFTFDAPLVTRPGVITPSVFETLREGAREEGIRVREMPSGAGHDTAVLTAAGIPAGMIFVANQNGSHNPYEAMKLDDFMLGTAVLVKTVELMEP